MSEAEGTRQGCARFELGVDVQPYRAGFLRRRPVGMVARGRRRREEVDG